MDNSIKNVVIVGGGTAGWVTAAALARVMPPETCQVTLVESDAIGTVGVGEATIPPIQHYHQMLGLNEVEFIRCTQATFKLGIDFIGWGRQDSHYFHPFGQYGREFDSVSFHQYWLRAQTLADCGDLSDYSMCTLAARQGRFAPSNSDPGSLLSTMGYAYHFDASLYAACLREYAEVRGVNRVEGKVIDVRLDSNDGFIRSVTLASSQQVEGDFFIDCTGFAGLLIEKVMNVGFENWSHYLPADRAVAVPSANVGPARPYTQSIARSAGWQWRIPLQHRTGNGFVYCSDHISDDEATETLLSNLEGEALASPRTLSFTTGRRHHSWHKNCLAIGLSAGFLEPLESTSIHLIQTSVSRLLQLFPGKDFNPADIREFNQQTQREYEFVRDFIILHYHANQRPEPLWQYCRSMDIPQTLADRIELFKHRGRIFEREEDLFKKASWLAVLRGQGVHPEAYDPIANAKPEGRLVEMLQEMRRVFRGGVEAMPQHDEFIDQYCRAS
jgi:tryptophan halogenase